MKKVSEMVIDDVKVILNIDGKEVEAIPATEEELRELETEGIAAGCNCGVQVCHRGYVWVCRFRRPNCYWYKTRVRCNG
ncbi:hypothetical protein H3Z83_07465 [Tenacibaculum sp. S7007]|uniref:Uncharacterized protein n=1 Tax=Tenacibaculum pelagium TaxID=2759527 RepID=A0A839AQ53_9FLAO|nr:hypothetical protein [Tenacibaculum pelagium]MBA6156349.1 hypothetical protein [Tenacibaculum pelagium]